MKIAVLTNTYQRGNGSTSNFEEGYTQNNI